MTYTEPCQVIAFPLIRRMGKIRDVATKMLAKSTDRHAESYRDQVTAALLSHLTRIGVPQAQQGKQLTTFWAAVQTEIIRQSYRQQA
ncbi:MAG: hypothetical protein EOR30_24120 [Mesorhizobium sp.]|uniref:DUF6074 family protein n=1 Tax=unclassified Mesorhizobium TaxID=325217 RepID=UPI000FCC00E2|nr:MULTISPECIES: DUF6074 family protein [unclassified Mesorhizobium]RUV69094.1 hypothetical protein EOA78_24745 [Mesorhizobium sp. M5C.F.Cr.IN.023.01.1.1]RWF84540.1 MAG: hypothetical protein EOQ36_25595 [Mesorhizobium sp.]RWF90764.1 MAG: hypothetical protein EOQ45_28775 [Mesorhizobium sp.]RWI43513.1 MAG: hypothetical protein EOR14_02775 [Mesorhizobium sp.]RWI44337.1 MAG: hypothetical protein EOR15_26350 [Mesorhizobium sp.]